MMINEIFLPIFGIIALLFVVYKNSWVSKQDPGDEKMQNIANHIANGAMAFLKAEYKILTIFVVAVAIHCTRRHLGKCFARDAVSA